jgi:replicative DNA helicase
MLISEAIAGLSIDGYKTAAPATKVAAEVVDLVGKGVATRQAILSALITDAPADMPQGVTALDVVLAAECIGAPPVEALRQSLSEISARIVASAVAAAGRDLAGAAKAGNIESVLLDHDATMEKIRRMNSAGGSKKTLRAFDYAQKAVANMKAANARGTGIAGVSTGLKDLDKAINGLCPGDLVIIAGRPAMGKSALAMNIAYGISLRALDAADPMAGDVAFFSLEMPGDQLVNRILSEITGIAGSDIAGGRVDKSQIYKVEDAAETLDAVPLHIIDELDTLNGIVAEASRIKMLCPDLKVFVIDYIQLMEDKTGAARGENKVAELTRITKKLKRLAIRFGVAIIGLAQVNRELDTRDGHIPYLSDLRDSGSLEQDADKVIFVHRQEYYVKQAEPKQAGTKEHKTWQNAMATHADLADLICAKVRGGVSGSTVQANFDGETTKFSNLN